LNLHQNHKKVEIKNLKFFRSIPFEAFLLKIFLIFLLFKWFNLRYSGIFLRHKNKHEKGLSLRRFRKKSDA